jgi:hypothetical protein
MLDSITQALQLVISASAGLGSVLIMRWYWWRISAYSELAALLTPLGLSIVNGCLQAGGIHEPLLEDFPENLYFYVIFTTVVWLLVTFTTAPTSEAVLDAFYTKVKPRGFGWIPVAARCPAVREEINKAPSMVHSTTDWLTGVLFVYGTLFGVGNCIFQNYGVGLALLFLLVPLTATRLWWSLTNGVSVCPPDGFGGCTAGICLCSVPGCGGQSSRKTCTLSSIAAVSTCFCCFGSGSSDRNEDISGDKSVLEDDGIELVGSDTGNSDEQVENPINEQAEQNPTI